MFGLTRPSEPQHTNGHLKEAPPSVFTLHDIAETPHHIAGKVTANVRAMPLASLLLSGLAGIGLYAVFNLLLSDHNPPA